MGFDKNDVMRGGELAVLAAVAVMMILFILRPLLAGGASAGAAVAQMLPAPAPTRLAAAPAGQPLQLSVDPLTGQLALPGPAPGNAELEHKIDIARIEGQVKASSVKRVAEFVERHPEESVAILRSWLHE
jgi:flagellar M-ring protein FliF